MKKFLLLIAPILIFAKCNYKLDLEIDLDKKELNGVATIVSDKIIELKDLDINRFEDISYSSSVKDTQVKFKKKYKTLISKDFVHLLGNWYPRIKHRCSYEVKLRLPKNFEAIMEAQKIESSIKNGEREFKFIMKKEIDSISLIASSDFVISRKTYNSIDIYTYFFKKDQKLSKKYLDKAVEYIKSYEKSIGEFPYKRFSVVENRFQTGYSMPTFTLIGDRIIGKEYLLNRSLGHEILHQYFGNSVFNDFSKGNWVEGLVTYLADWQLEKNRVLNRKSILNSYPLYLKKGEFPIKKFEYRVDKKSMLIGYSKLAFVFYMIENQIGKEEFWKIVKKIYSENSFTEVNLNKLSKYFDFGSWLDRVGMIDFEITELSRFYDRDGFHIKFRVVQKKDNFYKFDLPIEIESINGVRNSFVSIKKPNQIVKIDLKSEPLKITFDKEYKLFRKLIQNEKIATIAQLLESEYLLIVKYDDKYRGIEKLFKNAKIINFEEFKYSYLKESNILILDKKNELLKQLKPNLKIDSNALTLRVFKNIYNPKNSISVLHTNSDLKRLRTLKYYSKYSNISFSKDKIQKSTTTSQNGIVFKFGKKPKEIMLKDSAKIIYVGEIHDKFSHHLTQLRVIKKLYKKSKKIAIGMEMFRDDFQSVIDEYIADKITLKEFLKQSHYFKSWKFNYNLYKPIIDFAKENKIKIVALNIDREITKKVSKSGLYSLTKQERLKLPKEMNQLNESYKKRLTSFFNIHTIKNDKRFKRAKINPDFYYQAQLIWDEKMAENIDKFMKTNPDYKMVVVAGDGHIRDENAIPKRVFRRDGFEYDIVKNEYKYIKEMDVKGGKKIGVYLQSDDNLTVIKIVPHSYASKAKIKKGQKIVKINGVNVKSLGELKFELFFIDDLNSTEITFE